MGRKKYKNRKLTSTICYGCSVCFPGSVLVDNRCENCLPEYELLQEERDKRKPVMIKAITNGLKNGKQSKKVKSIKTKPLESKDYKRYMKSAAWRTKSKKAKKRAGYRCQFCNRHQSEVTLHSHHRTYERLGREYQNDLTVFCEDCHNILEKHSKHKPSKVKR